MWLILFFSLVLCFVITLSHFQDISKINFKENCDLCAILEHEILTVAEKDLTVF